MTTIRDIALVGMFITLSIVVPIFFHALGLGKMFLPMFIPILLAGFFLNPYPAMVVGFASPWLSALLTGMPPLLPTAPIMCVEGLALAGISSYLYRRRHWPLLPSLILAILAERVVLAATIFLIAPLFNFPAKMFSVTALTLSLPGIAVQLFLIPILVILIEKATVSSNGNGGVQ